MLQVLNLGDLTIDVLRKDIKNVHLSVHPPTGRIRIAAPLALELSAIRAFAISHIAWIKKNQRKLFAQAREPSRDYIDRESHFVWGERVLLERAHRDASPSVELVHRTLVLSTRANTTRDERHQIVEKWYRDELRRVAEPMIVRWEDRLGVKVKDIFIQRMKTKWGSCRPQTRNIRLNTDLAKKPPECLDYVLLHELAHLLERNHSDAFFAVLDHNLPQWREIRRLLNNLPLNA
jgi:predicted metal-dependent hydrolase